MTYRCEIRLLGAAGEYMEQATVIEWLVPVGAAISKDAAVVVIETAKAASEIAAPCAGVLESIAADVGREVPVGALLGVIRADVAPDEAARQMAASASDAALDMGPGRADHGGLSAAPALSARQARDSAPAAAPAPASPLAKRLARELGVDLVAVRGTGSGGRITETDVRRAVTAHGQTAPAARAELGYRKAMQVHMARTRDIPQFSVGIDCDGTAMGAVREWFLGRGVRVTVTDLLAWATAQTLPAHRRLNARFEGGVLSLSPEVNLAIAIATDHGLVAPVVHRADALQPDALSARLRELRDKAERVRLAPEELDGGTFTISNLGPFGVNEVIAIVNPPQVAILALGAFRDRLFLDGDRLVARPTARLTLSGDHRAIDGADAARFLAELRRRIETGVTSLST